MYKIKGTTENKIPNNNPSKKILLAFGNSYL